MDKPTEYQSTLIEPPNFDKDWQNNAYLEAAGAIDAMQKGNWGEALEKLEWAVQQIFSEITKEDG